MQESIKEDIKTIYILSHYSKLITLHLGICLNIYMLPIYIYYNIYNIYGYINLYMQT